MPRPVLYRIDLTLLREKGSADKAQVPYGPAVVSFFLQGATSSNASGVTVPGGSSTIAVFDNGDVMAGDVVQAGVDGVAITVTAVNNPTQLTVSNAGSAFTLNPRTRLMPLSRRPEIHTDPLGTVPVGPNLLSDATGRAQGYTSRSRYDYVVQANTLDKAAFISASSSSGAAVNSLTWNHASSGGSRILFVAVALAPAPDEATIASVTYAGIPLTFVGETTSIKLYRLFEPPAGTYPVVVQLTPTSSGNVVGGAVTAAGVNPTTFITPATSTGSSTTPSVTLTAVADKSLTLAMVAVVNQATGVSVTPGSGQTERWDAFVGTSPSIVTGAGATKEIVGTGNQALSFTLSQSRAWQALATELRYSGDKFSVARLYVDAVGNLVPSNALLNAHDFVSIQAAIDALPATGGAVYAPGGTYVVSGITIPENKPVDLFGDGADRTIIFCADPEQDILRIESSLTTIENLTIKGPYLVPSDPNTKGRGVVIGVPGSPTDILRRVSIIGCRIVDTASWALYIRGTGDSPPDNERLLIWGHFERTDFLHNRTGGLVEVHAGNNANLFRNCSFCHFLGPALNAFQAASLSLQSCTFEDKLDDAVSYVTLDSDNNVVFDSCWFEQHFSGDVTNPFILIGVTPTGACREVSVHNCRFVRQTGDLPRLIKVDSNSKGVSIVNPTCHMVQAPKPFTTRAGGPDSQKDIYVLGESEVYLSGGVLFSDQAFEPALVIGPATATGVVIAGLGPRTTPPRVTETLRDSALSLARDKKHGDTIYNTTIDRLQEWSGAEWLPVRITPSGTGDNVTGTVFSGTGLARVSAYLTRSGAGTVELKIEWTDSVGARSSTIAIAPSPGSDFAQGQLVINSVAPGIVTYRVLNPLLVPWQVTISAEQI